MRVHPTALAVLLAVPSGAAAPPAVTTVGLVWFDPQDTLSDRFGDLREEVDSIFRGIGVEVQWTRGGPGTVYGLGGRPEVAVILLAEDRSKGPESIMGLVLKSPKPTRVAWVFVSNVRAALGHAIAPDEPHARDGLMSQALSRHFLLGERATIDPRCASAFLGRLAALSPTRDASLALRTVPLRGP